jgi:hypothetical protein
VLLIGGQVVVPWAWHNQSHTAELAPFVSRKIDGCGDRATYSALRQVTGAKP